MREYTYTNLSANGDIGLSMKEPNPMRKSLLKSFILCTTHNQISGSEIAMVINGGNYLTFPMWF